MAQGHGERVRSGTAEKSAAEDEWPTPTKPELAGVGEHADDRLHEEAGDGAGGGQDDGDVGIAHLQLLPEQRRTDGKLD